jgi:hypothetical protein
MELLPFSLIMELLPFSLIIDYLHFKEVDNLSQTCKNIRNILNKPHYLKKKYEKIVYFDRTNDDFYDQKKYPYHFSAFYICKIHVKLTKTLNEYDLIYQKFCIKNCIYCLFDGYLGTKLSDFVYMNYDRIKDKCCYVEEEFQLLQSCGELMSMGHYDFRRNIKFIPKKKIKYKEIYQLYQYYIFGYKLAENGIDKKLIKNFYRNKIE